MLDKLNILLRQHMPNLCKIHAQLLQKRHAAAESVRSPGLKIDFNRHCAIDRRQMLAQFRKIAMLNQPLAELALLLRAEGRRI